MNVYDIRTYVYIELCNRAAHGAILPVDTNYIQIRSMSPEINLRYLPSIELASHRKSLIRMHEARATTSESAQSNESHVHETPYVAL